MKGIIITLMALIFTATVSTAQETKTIEKTKIKTETVQFKAKDGEKPDKKQKKVRAKIKAEDGKKKKKTKVKFKAEDGEKKEKKKVKANF